MPILPEQLEHILEAALLVAGRPMSLAQLEAVFEHDDEKPARDELTEALKSLQQSYQNRGIELVEVASGWRLQSRQELSPWIANLFQEKSPRYSRALLETLVLVAYRQPITRGEIEDVRGVAVSTNIMRTLLERDWVKVVGHRDVPGRPALYATTRVFLDYFGLKKIGDLPTLSEIKALDEIAPELAQEISMIDAEVGETEVGETEVGGSAQETGAQDVSQSESESQTGNKDVDGVSGDGDSVNPDSGEQENARESVQATDESGEEPGTGPETQSSSGTTDDESDQHFAKNADSSAGDMGSNVDVDLMDDSADSDSEDPATDNTSIQQNSSQQQPEEHTDTDEDAEIEPEVMEIDGLDIREATVDALSGESRRDTETLH